MPDHLDDRSGIRQVERYLLHQRAGLREGTLVSPFSFADNSKWAYWLVCAEERLSPVSLRKFKDWILGEAAFSRKAIWG